MPKFEQGDFVQARYNADRGAGSDPRGRILTVVVECVYDDDGLASCETWYGPNPMRFVNSVWYRVGLHNGSTAYIPEELLTKIEPCEINNRIVRSYFPDTQQSEARVRRGRWSTPAMSSTNVNYSFSWADVLGDDT